MSTDGGEPIRAVLEFRDQDGRAARALLLEAAFDVLVGRGDSAMVRVDDPSVSLAHARLSDVGNGIVVTDLGSASGTYVNGGRIDRPTAVAPGDELRFGAVTAVLLAPTTARRVASSPGGPARPARSGLEPERAIDDGLPARGAPPDGWRTRRDLPREAPDAPEARDAPVPDPGVVQGTVVKVVPPGQGNPYLHLDVNTDDGRTVSIRALFLSPSRVPALSEGQHVRIVGRVARSGYLTPYSIDNDTTGVRWRRRSRTQLAVGVVVLAAVLAALLLVVPRLGASGGGPPEPTSTTVPDIVGKRLEIARSDLREAGLLNVTEVGERNAAAIFTVIRTDPPAGTGIGTDSRVQVFFSLPI